LPWVSESASAIGKFDKVGSKQQVIVYDGQHVFNVLIIDDLPKTQAIGLTYKL